MFIFYRFFIIIIALVQAIGKNVLYMATTALTIYLKLSINYIKLLVLRYAQFTK